MDPEKIIENLITELNKAVKEMSKAKTAEDKVAHSQVVKNISESLGVFFKLAGDMFGYDMDDDGDEDY